MTRSTLSVLTIILTCRHDAQLSMVVLRNSASAQANCSAHVVLCRPIHRRAHLIGVERVGVRGALFQARATQHDPVGCQACGHTGTACSQQVDSLTLRHVAKCPGT